LYGQNPYNQYKETQVKTASPEKLMFMLFDGGLTFMKQGKAHLENKEIKDANYKLQRAQAIILELMNSLDDKKGGEISTNLMSLYEYMLHELIQANVKKDPERIDHVMKLMKDMKDTFSEAAKKLTENSDQAPKAQAGGISGTI